MESVYRHLHITDYVFLYAHIVLRFDFVNLPFECLWRIKILLQQNSFGGYNHAGNPTEILHLFNVSDHRQYSGGRKPKVENEIDVASILTL